MPAKRIDWNPIATIPSDQMDGRQVLLWAHGFAVIARFRSLGTPSHARWYVDVPSASGERDLEFAPKCWAYLTAPS